MSIRIPGVSFFQDAIDEVISAETGRDMTSTHVYTRGEVESIAYRLANDINAGYIDVLVNGGAVAPSFAVSVSSDGYSAQITFSGLRRPSFEIPARQKVVGANGKEHYRFAYNADGSIKGSGMHTGEGIDDIFALVTQGYVQHGNPWGLWRGWLTVAPRGMSSRPFVKGVVEEYESRYPGLHIDYPDEWM